MYLDKYTRAYPRTCQHDCMTCTCMYVHVNICNHTRPCIRIYIYAYIFIHIYMQTCRPTGRQARKQTDRSIDTQKHKRIDSYGSIHTNNIHRQMRQVSQAKILFLRTWKYSSINTHKQIQRHRDIPEAGGAQRGLAAWLGRTTLAHTLGFRISNLFLAALHEMISFS